jgi:hypothetical protein
MPARIAGFAAYSNQTLQFQQPISRAFLPQINELRVIQGRLHSSQEEASVKRNLTGIAPLGKLGCEDSERDP